MCILQRFGNVYEIKFDLDNEDPIMEVVLEDPRCGRDSVKGVINNLIYDNNNNGNSAKRE